MLALLLVEALAHVVADLLDQLVLGERLLGPAEHEAHAIGHVDGLEQLDLALGGELGPPADEVGQPTGIVGVDAAEDAADLPVAEVLEQGAQGRPQLGAEGLGLVGRGRLLDALGGDPQAGAGADHAGAEPGPARGADHEGLGAAGQHAGRLDVGEGADPGEAVADPGHEQELAAGVLGGGRGGPGLLGLGRDRHDHPREDHAVGKGQGGKGVGLERLGHDASGGVTCDLQATT